MLGRSVIVAPNVNGSVGSVDVGPFGVWWTPAMVRCTLATDATVGDRRIQLQVNGGDITNFWAFTPRAPAAATAWVIPASTQRQLLFAMGIQETLEDTVLQYVNAPLPRFLVAPEWTFRISLVDSVAGDSLSNIKILFDPL